MKQLPKYAFLQSNELEGKKVICLERPYYIADVRTYKRDDEYVSRCLEDMAQGRYPIAKVKGYTIFLKMFTSIEPNSNQELQQIILNEMANFI